VRQLGAYELSASGNIQYDQQEKPQLLQRETTAGIFANTNGFLTSLSNGEYVFELTAYVQALLDGRKPNYGLMIYGADEFTATLRQNLALMQLNSMLFYNQLPNTSHNRSGIKLEVYYSPYK